MSERNPEYLSTSDQMKLMGACMDIIPMGITLNTDMVNVCNLEYEDDFIRDTPSADLIFLSWVNKDLNNPNARDIGGESPLLKLGHTWKGAIEKSNAPVLVLATDDWTCVGVEDVLDNYQHIRNPDSSFPVYVRNDISLSI